MKVTGKPFPNLEAGLIEWASSLDGLRSDNPATAYMHVGDELPSRYAGRLPFLEISSRGGRTDGLTLFDEIEFYAFAKTRNEARSLLARVFASIDVYPRIFGGISVDTVQVTVYPRRSKQHEPDDDTFCYSGELTASLRR